MRIPIILLAAAALAVAAVACGGSSKRSDTPTTAAGATSSAPAKSPSAATKSPTAGSTASASAAAAPTPGASAQATPPAAAATPAPATTSAAPAAGGATFTAAQAASLLADIVLTPKDLPADWVMGTDTTQDNAAAAAADPTSAASNERCGRLLGRTVTNMPKDVVSAYIGGQSVSFFTNATVFATVAGATDCANEAGVRLQQPGALARTFGTLFVNPDAVVVTPVTFPTVGDGSFAANLTGQVNASGTVVDITILVVAFRKGNVSAAVGSAASSAPSVAELTPLVNLVLQRITQDEGQ